jgi:N-acetylmuramoyl-L-alanine amidase
MNTKSNYHWIIDAGHGGIDPKTGVYTTAPSKMFKFEDGLIVYEGVINRGVAKKLHTKLSDNNIEFSLVYDDVHDTALRDRSALINTLHKKYPSAISVSIHSNAGGGHGVEVFTSPGQTKSDIIAEPLSKLYKKNLSEFKFRADTVDGDLDKEANFWMITKVTCPAILVENLFFDTRDEAEFLMSETGQERIAQTLFEWILLIEETKPI